MVFPGASMTTITLRRSRVFVILALCICVVSWMRCVASSSSPAICPNPTHQALPSFVISLLSQCHLSFYHPSSALQVDGNNLERALTSKTGNMYTALLFHASWCPFSQHACSTFDVLSSMYPQIEHLVVEQSSVMPSLFSRYGIHSLPAILMVNQTTSMRFHGSKDLDSLVKFYRKTTGHEPVQYIAVDQSGCLQRGEKSVLQLWAGSFTNETLTREPYLLFCVFFLLLRLVAYLFTKVLVHLRALWISYRPHPNLESFGWTSQILGRILHLVSFERVWTKLRLYKGRNFHQGARNARVWASSLASVSLGETSTSRL